MKEMNAPTKKDWLNITANNAHELYNMAEEVSEALSSFLGEIRKLEDSIRWSWERYADADGEPKAVYWDNATAEERAMLDYYAKLKSAEQFVKNQLIQASCEIKSASDYLHSIMR